MPYNQVKNNITAQFYTNNLNETLNVSLNYVKHENLRHRSE